MALSPANIDALCATYIENEAALEVAKANYDAARAPLIAAIEKHGYLPPNADKSRRLDGDDYIPTITTSTTVNIKPSIVIELEKLLSRIRKHDLFADLFAREVKYSLVKDAADALKTAKLTDKTREKVVFLFAQAFDVNSKAPGLKVETRAALLEREEKAAKKAAKKNPKAAAK